MPGPYRVATALLFTLWRYLTVLLSCRMAGSPAPMVLLPTSRTPTARTTKRHDRRRARPSARERRQQGQQIRYLCTLLQYLNDCLKRVGCGSSRVHALNRGARPRAPPVLGEPGRATWPTLVVQRRCARSARPEAGPGDTDETAPNARLGARLSRGSMRLAVSTTDERAGRSGHMFMHGQRWA
jgi:hypothetical protein